MVFERGRIAVLALATCAWAGMSAAPARAATECALPGSWTQTTQEVGMTDGAITTHGSAPECGIGGDFRRATLSDGNLTITWTAPTAMRASTAGGWTPAARATGTLTFTKVDPGEPRAGKSYPSSVTGPRAPVAPARSRRAHRRL